jgi:hypothetical protein
MKTSLIFGILFLSVATIFAQTCPHYYPLQAGNYWELTNYDKKDKVGSINLVTVNSVENNTNGFVSSLTIKTNDAKGKESGTNQLVMKCEAGIFYFDMQNFIPAETLEGFKEMEVSVEANNMQYPAVLAENSALPDASITMVVKNAGMTLMTIVINITNRKVVGKETITVPAGTFDTWKISYNVDSKMGFVKVQSSVIEYLSLGSGMVKSETYNDKGALMAYTLLTKLVIK